MRNAQKTAVKSRNERGEMIIEMIPCLFVLVLVSLFLLDIGSAVLVSHIGDNIAKNAARAAANQSDSQKAREVAEKTAAKFNAQGIIAGVTVTSVDYVPRSRVAVNIRVNMNMPAPFPVVMNPHSQHCRTAGLSA